MVQYWIQVFYYNLKKLNNLKGESKMKSLLGKLITKCRGIILRVGIKLGIIKSDSIYYMGGVNILPPPLKPDEENALLQRLEKDESVKTTLIENQKITQLFSYYFSLNT